MSISKYKEYTGLSCGFKDLDIGWYLWGNSKMYHFGRGYVTIRWGHTWSFSTSRCGSLVNKQVIKDFLKVRDIDLYKVVYGI